MQLEDTALGVCSSVGAMLISLGYIKEGGIFIGLGGILKAVWPQSAAATSAPTPGVPTPV